MCLIQTLSTRSSSARIWSIVISASVRVRAVWPTYGIPAPCATIFRVADSTTNGNIVLGSSDPTDVITSNAPVPCSIYSVSVLFTSA